MINSASGALPTSSLEDFLKCHSLHFLFKSLTDIGLVDVSDLRFLTPDLIDTVEVMTQMPLIQRRKFQHVIESQRQSSEQLDELHKTEKLKQIYSTKYDAMKILLDSNKITEAEFDEWRHEEFLRTFNTVSSPSAHTLSPGLPI